MLMVRPVLFFTPPQRGPAQVSADAVPSLTRALDDENEIIRFAAAEGIATGAPKGTTSGTADKLVEVIQKSYPPQ